MPAPKRPLLRTYKLYRRHIGLVTIVLLLSVLANGTFGVQQHLFAQAVNVVHDGFAQGDLSQKALWWACGIVLGVACLRGLLGYANGILGMVLGQKILFRLRSDIFNQIIDLDQRFHRRFTGGDLIARTTRDSDKVRDAVVIGTRHMVDTAMYQIGGIAYLFYCNIGLGLVPFALQLTSLWIILKQADRLVVLNRATDDAYDTVTQEFTEGVTGIRVVKAFGLENARFARFTDVLGTFMQRARQALLYTATRLPLPQVVLASCHAWIMWYGASLVAENRLDLGSYIAAIMLVTGLIFRMDAMGRIMRIFADARASAARVWEVLDARSHIDNGTESLPAGPLGIQLNKVHVGNEQEQHNRILADCSLTLAPGHILALVGPTGCGKSTLCSLLPRLRDPEDGSVLIGSDSAGWIPLTSVRLQELRQDVQVVYQGSFLFSESVANNVRLAVPEADDAAVLEAMQAAAADEILERLPDGLQTRIGERGLTVSGGQRQRLCLARALLAKPRLLILDDATSALDAVTERRILENLRRNHADTTVLIVASRLSSIQLADSVAVLDDGRILATGSHAELAASNARYRDLLCLDEAGGEVHG